MAKSKKDRQDRKDRQDQPPPTYPPEATLLLRLGESLFGLGTLKYPDPFANKSDKPEADLITAIADYCSQFKTLIASHSSLIFLRDLLGANVTDLSDLNSQPSDDAVKVLGLLAYMDFFHPCEETPDTLVNKLASFHPNTDKLNANLLYRKVISGLLEKGVICMEDRTVHLSAPISQWITGGDLLCAARMNATYVQKVLQTKKAKANKAPRDNKGSQENRENQELPANNATKPISSALELYNKLKNLVIGQDEACKVLATRGWLHLKRAEMLKAGKNVGTNECLLFIGESGVGKTLLGESYGKLCSFPFTCFNSTDATSIGYVGLDLVEDGIKSLIRAAGDNPKDPITIEKARLGGIIFYDEFTKKMASPASNNSSGRDISGIAVQQEILRAMEGCKVIIGGRKEKETGMEFDTNGILFLFAGYVEGLDRIIVKLNRQKGSMGFNGFSNQSLGTLGKRETPRDAYLYDAMVDFGFIPEFVNRLTKIVQFRKLTQKDLETIATSPSGVIASYNRQLAPLGLSIKVSNQAISMMAGFCVETGMLARGLRMILGSLVEDLIFNGATGEIPFLSKDVKRVIEGMSVGKS